MRAWWSKVFVVAPVRCSIALAGCQARLDASTRRGVSMGTEAGSWLRRRVQFGSAGIGQIANGRLCRAPSRLPTMRPSLAICGDRYLPRKRQHAPWLHWPGNGTGPGMGPGGRGNRKRRVGVWMEHGCCAAVVAGRRFEGGKRGKMSDCSDCPCPLFRAYEYGSFLWRTRGRRQLFAPATNCKFSCARPPRRKRKLR